MIRSCAVTALVLVAIAGCSSTKSAGPGAPTTPTSSSGSSAAWSSEPVSSTVTSSSAVSTPTAMPAAVPLCTNDIRVIPGGLQGAAGHLALVLIFNNVSRTTTCKIIGYPGVDLVNSSGATVAHLSRTLRGMAGGEPAGVTAPQGIVLAPGQSASALAEASDVPQGGITNCGSYSLLVTVPNQYVSVPGGTAMLPRCEAEIHPVVPGTGGGKK